MPCAVASGAAGSDKDAEPFVEVDPSGRYGRYSDLLGAGAVKKVYRGFDQEEGIEIAWNQVRLRCFADDSQVIERLYSEVRLLRSLRHGNIIVLHHVWTDEERGMLNFITEVCTSGNLREYRRRHRHVSLKALKKWSRQILRGLEYLHTYDPCIIHRDINCSNVFVNGNIGQVMIGDLGLHCYKQGNRLRKKREPSAVSSIDDELHPSFFSWRSDHGFTIAFSFWAPRYIFFNFFFFLLARIRPCNRAASAFSLTPKITPRRPLPSPTSLPWTAAAPRLPGALRTTPATAERGEQKQLGAMPRTSGGA